MFDFTQLGLAPELTKTIETAGFSEPTPIQAKAIPLALDGHDIMGLAQTGTGKTLAFGLPLINDLLQAPGKPAARTAKALILAPTRELVNQISDSLRALTGGTKLRIVTVVGGQSIGKQTSLLARGTDILVATPGRLIDLMNRGAVDLGEVRQLVLDEADQMLDMGFIHDLRKIAPKLGEPRQTMLFSATMPKQMEELSGAYLHNPKRVQVAAPGKAADKVEQSLRFADKSEKSTILRELLSVDPDALSLVFARTKHGAERLMKGLVKDGFNAASIHGNKTQGQRDRAIKAFRDGTVTILVATDVAARGIDIPGVEYVINYDLPNVPDNYVHRIGRTARAGREGQAITLCAPDELDQLRQIEKLMKMEIPMAEGEGNRPSWARAPAPGAPKPKGKPNQRRRGGGGGGQGKSGPKPEGANAQSRNKRRRPRRAKAA